MEYLAVGVAVFATLKAINEYGKVKTSRSVVYDLKSAEFLAQTSALENAKSEMQPVVVYTNPLALPSASHCRVYGLSGVDLGLLPENLEHSSLGYNEGEASRLFRQYTCAGQHHPSFYGTKGKPSDTLDRYSNM